MATAVPRDLHNSLQAIDANIQRISSRPRQGIAVWRSRYLAKLRRRRAAMAIQISMPGCTLGEQVWRQEK